MQCILCKIYFWKVFHKYYNLICTPICTKNFILVKSGCYMDTPAAEEGASLATSRWCRSRDCRRRATSGALLPLLLLVEPLFLTFHLPLLLPFPSLLGWGQEGEWQLEDSVVRTEVGVVDVATAEDALLLRVWSRTRRPVPGPSSCPSRSP
jgi:hypothetical protein